MKFESLMLAPTESNDFDALKWFLTISERRIFTGTHGEIDLFNVIFYVTILFTFAFWKSLLGPLMIYGVLG